MPSSSPLYFSYLLRLWQAGDGSQRQWRASLEDPHSGELRGFASLEELTAFLRQQTQLEEKADEPGHPREEGKRAA
jgi:hypothetical protein